MNSYDIPGKDLLEKSIQDLMEIEYLQENPPYQHILEQLQLILTPIKDVGTTNISSFLQLNCFAYR